jgi:hypothetical protein
MIVEDVMTADVSAVVADASGHEPARLIAGVARADTNGAR